MDGDDDGLITWTVAQQAGSQHPVCSCSRVFPTLILLPLMKKFNMPINVPRDMQGFAIFCFSFFFGRSEPGRQFRMWLESPDIIEVWSYHSSILDHTQMEWEIIFSDNVDLSVRPASLAFHFDFLFEFPFRLQVHCCFRLNRQTRSTSDLFHYRPASLTRHILQAGPACRLNESGENPHIFW